MIEWVNDLFYDDFLKRFEDVIKVYDYIKGTKKNQIELIKEMAAMKEEELAAEKEQEALYEKERLSLIDQIKNAELKEIVSKLSLNKDIQKLISLFKEANCGWV